MALTAAESNFISRSSAATKTLLDLFGTLEQLNQLWAGAPDYDTTITQEDIDSIPSFAESGLTIQVLADAEFAMAGIKTSIGNALPSFTVMANLP